MICGEAKSKLFPKFSVTKRPLWNLQQVTSSAQKIFWDLLAVFFDYRSPRVHVLILDLFLDQNLRVLPVSYVVSEYITKYLWIERSCYRLTNLEMGIKDEIIKHYHGVVQVLTTLKDYTSEVAWAVGSVAILVAYPLAMTITEDRVLTGRAK